MLMACVLLTSVVRQGCLSFLHRLVRKDERTNVIFMVSDGYGPASTVLGRTFLQVLHNNTAPDAHYMTPLDHLLVGTHRSRSANSLVTDSAAGATAFACGRKTNNYAIGVDARGASCGTVLEGAKDKGMLTGVVVTTRITDATPAAFFAHVASRGLESSIANEVFGLDAQGNRYRAAPLDLAIGGGGCLFFPQSDPRSCRQDDQDLLGVASAQGWTTNVLFSTPSKDDGQAAGVSRTSEMHNETLGSLQAGVNDSALAEFRHGADTLPLLTLLTPANMPFVIDRPASIPGLPELSIKALHALQASPKNAKGFFLMIEGSQIDLCSHNNDPACHAREIEEYQETVRRVVEWVEKANERGERTLLVSTSDHETGGLALARQLSTEPGE